MKQRIITLALALLITMAGTAQADLATFTDTLFGGIGDTDKVQINSSASKTFVLDILRHVYSKTDYTITGANLFYTFSDTDAPDDPVVVLTGVADGELEIFKATLDLSNKSGTTYSGSYTFSTPNLSYLTDGMLSLTISSDKTIDVDQLRLEVQANPVPLPGAVWFLGSGLMGLAALRRRKAANVA